MIRYIYIIGGKDGGDTTRMYDSYKQALRECLPEEYIWEYRLEAVDCEIVKEPEGGEE